MLPQPSSTPWCGIIPVGWPATASLVAPPSRLRYSAFPPVTPTPTYRLGVALPAAPLFRSNNTNVNPYTPSPVVGKLATGVHVCAESVLVQRPVVREPK